MRVLDVCAWQQVGGVVRWLVDNDGGARFTEDKHLQLGSDGGRFGLEIGERKYLADRVAVGD